MSNSVKSTGTPRSSSASAKLAPAWRPPKSPLAPHRLAKLANALGVSTPIPANSNHASINSPSFLARSSSETSGSPDNYMRSSTPSVMGSSMGYNPPSTSKFLLHVVPPIHLPHDSDTFEDSDLTAPPPTASGYHTQFRRGTLVTVHSTLQAQLSAIAREYALPSTAGLILYLVTSGTSTGPQSPLSPGSKPSTLENELAEPGPRLSEDIWKHLWTRVVQAEQRDGNMMIPSRSPTPLMLNMAGARSTPFLPNQEGFNGGNLRPLLSPSPSPISPRPSYPLPPVPSPSTLSSVSDLRSSSKSAPPSSASQSEPGTPDTSVADDHMRGNSLDLPGLNSPSLIPILAKVEFDIDRRKAAWYEPWLRSRKVNHAKRAGSRASRKSSAAEGDEDEEKKDKVPAIPLLIGRKQTASPLSLLQPGTADATDQNGELGEHEEHAVGSSPSVDPSENEGLDPNEPQEEEAPTAGYEKLGDAHGNDDSGSDDESGEDSTARVSSIVQKKDPLQDVFGADADTRSDLKSERRATHEINPDFVNLSLTGADLTIDSFNSEVDVSPFAVKEEEEVRELLERMSRGSQKGSGDALDELVGSPTQGKKHIPPPLVLIPKDEAEVVIESNPVPPSAASATGLAYLSGGDSPEDLSDKDMVDDSYAYRARSPTESEKRAGALFEDLDLGLDPSDDFDDDDPNDRRRSQYVMKAQLDEIERTLAQLSPRMLKADLEEDINQSFNSATLSPGSPAKLTLSPLRNSGIHSASSPRLPQHPDPPDTPSVSSWPAVPFSQIKEASSEAGGKTNSAPSPPRLAVNGVTTSAPRSFVPRNTNGEISSETKQRRKELDEENAFYAPIRQSTTDSSIIPLSPDPFGRFSSSTLGSPPIISSQIGTQWDTVTLGRSSITVGDSEPAPPHQRGRSGTTTSRFSVDSAVEEEEAPVAPNVKTRGTLMSVKTIKNLWRKGSKENKDKARTPSSSSGRVSPAVPQRPERPSQENLDLPDVPRLPSTATFGRFSPQPPPSSRSSMDSVRRPSQDGGLPSRPPPSHGARPSMEYGAIGQQGRPSQESSMPLQNGTRASMEYNGPQPRRPSQEGPPQRRSQDGPPPMHQGLSVPYPGRSNASPIVPAMLSRPGANLDRFHFDQESPYPNPIRTPRYVARTPSPPQQQQPLPPQQPHLPSIPEKEQLARKSILKWQSGGGNPAQEQHPEPRSSFERTLSNGGQTNGSGRAPGNGRRKASVTSISTDLPPTHPSSERSKIGASPVDSTSPPQHHRALGARPISPSNSSIDESQFEIVSPRLNSGMPYPSSYENHGLDS